jgi:hypothetical protein
LSDQIAVVERPWAPDGSTALSSAKQPTVCGPTPLTGTWALALANVCADPPSTVQTMSAIPDGLPPAVAVTYWVPAVDGASTGPASDTVGVLLST